MTKKTVAQICAVAAVVALPSLSFAGTATKKSCCSKAAPAPEKLNESAITGDIGINVVSSYYSRGVHQAGTSTANYQPYLNLNFKAYEGDGFLNKAVVSLGLWNNFTAFGSDKRTAGKSLNNWYESDFVPSLALTFGKITLSESLLIYTYPGSNTQTATGLQTKVSYDDSDLLGALALHPALSHVYEIEGKIGSGGNSDRRGHYWELSVAPGTAVGPVNVTLPLTVGIGQGGFYDKDGYGYFTAGLNLAYTLPVAKNYGTWSVNTGVTYINSDTGALNSNPRTDDVVVSAGLNIAF